MTASIDDSPRPSIIHMLGWMGATGLVLGVYRSGLSRAMNDDSLLAYPFVVVVALTTLHAAISGASICGLAVGIARVAQGRRFFHHPGHWLLAIGGAVALGHAAMMLVWHLGDFLGPQHRWITNLNLVLAAAVGLARPIAHGMAARFFPGERRWRVVFLAFATWSGLEFLQSLVGLFPWSQWRWTAMQQTAVAQIGNWTPLLILPVLAVLAVSLPTAAIIDGRRTRRDWLHWVGLGVGIWTVSWGLMGVVQWMRFFMF